ncbi:MAG: PTS sugar transporter subunit IIB [Brevinema sp.]
MRVVLICAGGFSTSILLKKILEEAEKREIPMQITAQGTDISNLKEELKSIDIILLAPQVRFYYEELKQSTVDNKPLILVINPMAYGRMDAQTILNDIENT